MRKKKVEITDWDPKPAKPFSGTGAVAKFNFKLDPVFVKEYTDLLSQGKTHQEAIDILERNKLPSADETVPTKKE